MKQLSMIEQSVLNALPHGSENPISTTDVCKLTDLKVRVVREIISVLVNRYGVPIVALRSGEHTGLFIATTEAERNLGIASYETQINSMGIRLRAIQEADLDNWESQLKPQVIPADKPNQQQKAE